MNWHSGRCGGDFSGRIKLIIITLYAVGYRLQQVRQQLGFVAPLTDAEYAEVQRLLVEDAFGLFRTMTQADQRHSLRVYQGLLARDCQDADLLRAALLHDVGKAAGRVPFWTRPVIVLGKVFAPALLRKIAIQPELVMPSSWLARRRLSLSYAWWHADVGARLAATAGLSEQAVVYIRTHHQPRGPAALLHEVDEIS